MQSEYLKSAKFLEITDEDLKFEGQVERLKRQEHLIGSSRDRTKLLLLVAICFGGMWGYSHLQGSKRGLIHSVQKGKEALQSMAGELNQEKKVWAFVDR